MSAFIYKCIHNPSWLHLKRGSFFLVASFLIISIQVQLKENLTVSMSVRSNSVFRLFIHTFTTFLWNVDLSHLTAPFPHPPLVWNYGFPSNSVIYSKHIKKVNPEITFTAAILYLFSSSDYLVDVIVDLISYFFELVVSHDEIPLVWVKVSILPATPNLSLIHTGFQVKGRL